MSERYIAEGLKKRQLHRTDEAPVFYREIEAEENVDYKKLYKECEKALLPIYEAAVQKGAEKAWKKEPAKLEAYNKAGEAKKAAQSRVNVILGQILRTEKVM